MWVLPGGDLEWSETFREAARRELGKEAGIEARYDGLAVVVRVEGVRADHEARGVMPVFGARATATATVTPIRTRTARYVPPAGSRPRPSPRTPATARTSSPPRGRAGSDGRHHSTPSSAPIRRSAARALEAS